MLDFNHVIHSNQFMIISCNSDHIGDAVTSVLGVGISASWVQNDSVDVFWAIDDDIGRREVTVNNMTTVTTIMMCCDI